MLFREINMFVCGWYSLYGYFNDFCSKKLDSCHFFILLYNRTMGNEEIIDKDKDIHISLLQDTLNDLREHNRFKNRIIIFLASAVVLCIIGVATLGIYYQEKFVNFMKDYDVTIENSFTSDNSSTTENNSVSVAR